VRLKTTFAAHVRCSLKLEDGAETNLEELGSTLLKAGLEGFAPPRRPYQENEDAAEVISAGRSSQVVLRLGGLRKVKIYVHCIGLLTPLTSDGNARNIACF
jgi:hypothetical protein